MQGGRPGGARAAPGRAHGDDPHRRAGEARARPARGHRRHHRGERRQDQGGPVRRQGRAADDPDWRSRRRSRTSTSRRPRSCTRPRTRSSTRTRPTGRPARPRPARVAAYKAVAGPVRQVRGVLQGRAGGHARRGEPDDRDAGRLRPAGVHRERGPARVLGADARGPRRHGRGVARHHHGRARLQRRPQRGPAARPPARPREARAGAGGPARPGQAHAAPADKPITPGGDPSVRHPPSRSGGTGGGQTQTQTQARGKDSEKPAPVAWMSSRTQLDGVRLRSGLLAPELPAFSAFSVFEPDGCHAPPGPVAVCLVRVFNSVAPAPWSPAGRRVARCRHRPVLLHEHTAPGLVR